MYRNLPDLLHIARRGPTGVQRPCRAIIRRLRDEMAELVQALRGGDIASILEEAGDVQYYRRIARANRCLLALWVARPPWKAVARTLQRRYPGITAREARDAATLAAWAKYHIRFGRNRRQKKHEEEHRAILATVDTWWKSR